MNPDDILVDTIRRALLESGRLSSQPITVIAQNGDVILRGTVQTFRRKRAALEIARGTEGATTVTDEIEVVPPGPMPDHEVAEDVRRMIESRDKRMKAAITVDVHNAVVTLHGNVASELERLLAEDTAIAAAGVRGVTNLLFVNPDAQAEDVGRARDLQTAINLTEGIRDAVVRAAVAGGVAVLSGSVSHAWQKQLAESVAQRMCFLAIRNEIEVCGTGAASPLVL